MQDDHHSGPSGPKRAPWNKGKLIGAKPPLRPKHVWSILPSSRSMPALATSRCSIWRSIASCAAAMSSPSRSRISPRRLRG